MDETQKMFVKNNTYIQRKELTGNIKQINGLEC